MENFGGSRKDIVFTMRGSPLSEIPENAVFFAIGNFREFNPEFFCRMESHLGFESAPNLKHFLHSLSWFSGK